MPNYTLDDGETLKNKFGLQTAAELEQAEFRETSARLTEISLGYGPQGEFDAEHLKALHRHIFQDVYEWAGHTRDERVALSDGTIATEPVIRKAGSLPFAVAPAIMDGLEALAGHLREANYLRDLPREVFAAQAADTMIELNAIHPFREGNGRTQRVFMEQLAEQAGHNLDFTVVSKERMVQASVAAHDQNDPSMMRRMFEEISNPERSAMLRRSIEQLEKANFPWNERYVATLTPDHGVDLILAGIAGDNFMARTENAVFFGRTADLPEPQPGRGEIFHFGATAANEQSVGQGADASRDFQGQIEAVEAFVGDALEGVAAVAEGVIVILADESEAAILSLATSFEGLLGGASAPAPGPARAVSAPRAMTPAERREARIRDQLANAVQDRTASLDEFKRQLGREVTAEEAKEIAAIRGGGGQSL